MQTQEDLNKATNELLKDMTAAHTQTLNLLLEHRLQYSNDNERNKVLFSAMFKEFHLLDPSARQRIQQNIDEEIATYNDKETGENIAKAIHELIDSY